MAGMGFPPNLAPRARGLSTCQVMLLTSMSPPHSSGSIPCILQLLVLTVVPHLCKALVHQLDGHVLSGLRVVACSADQENAALAEMKKEMLLGKQQVEHKLDHTFVI